MSVQKPINKKKSTGAQSYLMRMQVSPEVQKAVLTQYNREAIHYDKRLENTTLTGADWGLISSVEYEEGEISPFHANDIPLGENKAQRHCQREVSCRTFSKNPITFSCLDAFLCETVLADPKTKRRAYASGGGLYPIDAFLVVLASRISEKNLTSGVYHVRPVSSVLQPIVQMSEDKLLPLIFPTIECDNEVPHFALIYSVRLSKAIFKYRYRGYRNANIEVGMMGQCAGTVAQTMGLGSCMWGSFNDQQIRKALRLDPLEHLPLMTQIFGRPEA